MGTDVEKKKAHKTKMQSKFNKEWCRGQKVISYRYKHATPQDLHKTIYCNILKDINLESTNVKQGQNGKIIH